MSWLVSKAIVRCPNKDCGYIGCLKQFDCFLDVLESTDDVETVLTCPKCGCKFNATIESYVDYVVSEGDIVEASND